MSTVSPDTSTEMVMPLSSEGNNWMVQLSPFD